MFLIAIHAFNLGWAFDCGFVSQKTSQFFLFFFCHFYWWEEDSFMFFMQHNAINDHLVEMDFQRFNNTILVKSVYFWKIWTRSVQVVSLTPTFAMKINADILTGNFEPCCDHYDGVAHCDFQYLFNFFFENLSIC